MRSPWRDLIGRLVVVNLKSGTALRGVVWSERKGHVEMRDCQVIQGASATEPATDVRFPVCELDFYQVVQV